MFFDGGPHFGDLAVNLVFGMTVLWLPITFAALFRGLNLRYRFTEKRITIMSSLGDVQRQDFPYSVRFSTISFVSLLGRITHFSPCFTVCEGSKVHSQIHWRVGRHECNFEGQNCCGI